jgi:hypothetical protein
MLAASDICRSFSCWSSPLLIVKKKDRSRRPCADFRCLNLVTQEDISFAQHGRLGQQTGRLPHLFKTPEGLSSGPNQPHGRPQHGHHHPIWPLLVPQDAIWAQE